MVMDNRDGAEFDAAKKEISKLKTRVTDLEAKVKRLETSIQGHKNLLSGTVTALTATGALLGAGIIAGSMSDVTQKNQIEELQATVKALQNEVRTTQTVDAKSIQPPKPNFINPRYIKNTAKPAPEIEK